MSTIDQRVVQMDFDNSRFESNVSTTMSTLDKLKAKLHFGEEQDSLKDLEDSGKNFNLDHMASCVDTVANKFTLLGQIGFQAMERIAQKAVDAGETIVKSLTVDQISAGMTKYEQETNAVQAIYSAVKKNGTGLDTVYAALDKLTEYSDETSYSYTQMVDGVSKFVANGVDLDVAVKSMMGISNAAAISGVSIQDASIAYRNFSDALSAGKFMIKDWASIQNIHMDTAAFKEEVIASAKELKKLDSEGYIIDETGKRIKKGGEEVQLTIENFREMLSTGFFDSEVMLDVLGKYADFDWERVYNGEFKTLGDEAAAAAQNAKTFTDVMDAAKDAASTGWKQSFRIIFGDLNQAIELFTPMANAIIEVINGIDDARNLLLQSWSDNGGRDSMIEGLKVWWENLTSIGNLITEGFGAVFGSDMAAKGKMLAEFTQSITTAGEKFKTWLNESSDGSMMTRAQKLRIIFAGVATAFDLLRQVFGGIGSFFSGIFQQLKPTIDAVIDLFTELGINLFGLGAKLEANNFFQTLGTSISKWFEPITKRIPGWIKKLSSFGKSIAEFVRTNPTMVKFTTSIKNLANAIINGVPKAVEGLIQLGEGFINLVKNSDEWKWIETNFNEHVAPILSGVTELAGKLAQGLADFINFDDSELDGSWWEKLKVRFEAAFGEIGPWVQGKWEELKAKYPLFQDVEDWWNSSEVIGEIKSFVEEIGEAIDAFFSADTSGETSIFGKLKARFSAFWDSFGPWLNGKWEDLKARFPFIQKIQDWVTDTWGNLKTWWSTSPLISGLKEFGEEIGKAFTAFADTDTSGETTLLGKLKARFTAMWDELGPWLSEKWESFKSKYPIIEQISGFFSNLFGGAGENTETDETSSFIDKVKNVFDKIKEFVSSIDFGIVGKFAAVAVSLIAAFKTYKTLKSWVGIGSTIKGIFEGISDAIGSAQSYIKQKKLDSKLKSLIVIAGSIWLLADALTKVAELNWDQLAVGLTGLAGVFVETGGFMVALSFLQKKGYVDYSSLNIGQLIGIAAVIKSLGEALIQVAQLSWEEIARGLTAMAGLFAEEGAFMIAVTRLTKMENGVSSNALSLGKLIGIALNIKILASALKDLAQLTWDQIGIGLAAMGGIFLEEGAFIVVVTNLTKMETGVSSNAIGMGNLIGIAANIKILGDTLKDLAQMTWDQIGTGLTAMAGVFLEEGAFMVVVSRLTKVEKGKFTSALNMGTLIGMAVNLKSLGDTLLDLSRMTWDEIGRGLSAMAGVLLEEGGFMWILKKIGGDSINFGVITGASGVLGMGVGALGNAVAQLGQLDISSLAKGVIAVGVLGLVLTGLSALVSKIQGIKVSSVVGMAGIAGALWILVQALMPLTQFTDLNQLGPALGAMAILMGELGVLMLAVSALPGNVKLGSIVGAIAFAGALWLLVQALMPLTQFTDLNQILPAIGAMGLVMLELSAFMAIVSLVKVGIVSAFSALIVTISFVGLIFAFAAALDMVKGIDVGTISAFSEALGIITLCVVGISLLCTALGAVPLSMVLKGVAALAIIALAVSAIGAVVAAIAGMTISGLSDNMSHIGAQLQNFSLMMTSVDKGAIEAGMSSLKLISDTLIDVGTKEYGNVDSFRDTFVRLGADVKLFGGSIADYNSEAATAVIDDLVSMASKLSGLSEVADVSDTITHIGGAIKLYAESINGADLSGAPDSSQISAALKAIADTTLPETQKMSEIAGYASGDQAQVLNDFAVGIVNIGTAVKSFADDMADIGDFGNVTAGISALTKISELNNSLASTEIQITGISGFGITLRSNNAGLTQFAEDITLLGTALNSFGTDIGNVDIGMIARGVLVLGTIASIQNNLPNVGGLISWIEGDQSLSTFAGNITELGAGLANFANNINTVEDYDANKLKSAVGILQGLGEIYNAIPEGGGIAQWWEGISSLTKMGNELGSLGQGLADFATPLQDIKISRANMDSAVGILQGLGDLYNKIPNASGFVQFFTGEQNLGTFAKQLGEVGTGLRDFAVNYGNAEMPSDMDTILAPIKAMATLSEEYEATTDDIGVITKMSQLIGFAEDVKTVFTKMNELNDMIKIAIDNGLGDFTAFTTPMEALVELNERLAVIQPTETGVANFTQFGLQIQNFKTSMEAVLGEGNTLGTLVDSVVAEITKVTDILKDPFGTEGGAVPQDYSEVINGFVTSLSTGFANKEEDLKAIGKGVMINMAAGFPDAESEINAKLGTRLEAIATRIAEEHENIQTKGKELIEAFAGGFAPANDTVNTSFGDVLDLMINAITDSTTNDFVPGGESLMAAMAKGVSNKAVHVYNTLRNLLNTVSNSGASYGQSKFVSVGKYIDLGLASGISSNTGTVTSAIRTLIDKVKSAAEAQAKIQSPSRVFKEIGMYIDLGLAEGIDDSTSIVTGSATSLISSIQEATNNAISSDMQSTGQHYIMQFASGMTGSLSTAQKAAKTIASATGKTIVSAVGEASENLFSGVSFDIPKDIRNYTRESAEDLGNSITTGVTTGIISTSQQIIEAVENVTETVIDQVEASVKTITELVEDTSGGFSLNSGTTVTGSTGTITKDTKTIVEASKTIAEAAENETKQIESSVTAVEELKEIVEASSPSESISNMAGTKSILSQMDRVYGQISTSISMMGDSISTADSALIGMSESLYDISQSKQVQSGLDHTVDAVSGSISTIVNAITNGLSTGIQNSTGSITNAVASITNQMISTAKQVLQIQSPSRVFRKIGYFTDQGLVAGLKSNLNRVSDAAEDVANTVSETIRDVLGIHSPSEDGEEAGKMEAQGLEIGLKDGINGLKDNIQGALAGVVPTDFMQDLGMYSADALVGSFNNQAQQAFQDTENIFQNAYWNLNGILGRNFDFSGGLAAMMPDETNSDTKPKTSGKSGSGSAAATPTTDYRSFDLSGYDGVLDGFHDEWVNMTDSMMARMSLLHNAFELIMPYLDASTIEDFNNTFDSNIQGMLGDASELYTEYEGLIETLAGGIEALKLLEEGDEEGASAIYESMNAASTRIKEILGQLSQSYEGASNTMIETMQALLTPDLLAQFGMDADTAIQAFFDTDKLQEFAAIFSSSTDTIAEKLAKMHELFEEQTKITIDGQEATTAADEANDAVTQLTEKLLELYGFDSSYEFTFTQGAETVANAADLASAALEQENATASELMETLLAIYGLDPNEYDLDSLGVSAVKYDYDTGSGSGSSGIPVSLDESDTSGSGGITTVRLADDLYTGLKEQIQLVGTTLTDTLKTYSEQFATTVNDVNYDKIIASIGSVQDEVSTLGEKISNIQMVLDTGTLVGEMVEGIDAALGVRVGYAGRGFKT